MNISQTCNLLLTDLFDYDIVSCHYQLLESINWDMSDIPYEPKLERNIAIGNVQKGNKKLAKYLLEQTRGVVQYYINKNHISDDNIIVRMRDGILLNKPLTDNTSTLSLDFKGMVSKLIISMDRRKFLTIHDTGVVSVKGQPNKPIDDSFYSLFKNLNFSSKKSLTQTLEYIRLEIFKSQNVNWFAFKKDKHFYVPIIDLGEVRFAKSGLRSIDHDEIDKKIIWEEYLWPFVQPILLYCT